VRCALRRVGIAMYVGVEREAGKKLETGGWYRPEFIPFTHVCALTCRTRVEGNGVLGRLLSESNKSNLQRLAPWFAGTRQDTKKPFIQNNAIESEVVREGILNSTQ
jgi:hypothetical protein